MSYAADVVADVVVVGAGIAGLAAAHRAASAGKRVLVLEKERDESYLCNTRIATGVLNLAHTDPYLPAQALRKAIDDDTESYADPALADAIAATAGSAMEWIRGCGGKLLKVPVQGSPMWMLAPPRLPSTGHHWKGYGPDLLLRGAVSALEGKGGRLERGMRARGLLMEDGACRGVEAEREGIVVRYAARHVVLADGGFQGNPQLVRRFICARPEALVQRSAGTGTGDALVMAESAGARITDATEFYGHLLAQDALVNANLWPYPTLDTLAGAAILVDGQGQRFVDEGIGGITLSNFIAKMEDPLAATLVCDHAIWESSGRIERVAPNPHLIRAGGTVVTGPSLRELAVALGIAAENLEKTVSAYNAAVGQHRIDSLSPVRTEGREFGVSRASPKRVSLRPVVEPPFYAIRVCAGISFTMGGIAIDDRARVLDKGGRPIEGLLAAGSCTGGVEGGPVAGYIGGLLKACCFGLIAGASASGRH